MVNPMRSSCRMPISHISPSNPRYSLTTYKFDLFLVFCPSYSYGRIALNIVEGHLILRLYASVYRDSVSPVQAVHAYIWYADKLRITIQIEPANYK